MLQEYYEAVNISRTGFFDNLISVAKFSAHREWSALGKPTNRNEWDMTVPTVNVSGWPALSSHLIASFYTSVQPWVIIQVFWAGRSDLTSTSLGLLQPSWERNRFSCRHYASTCILQSFCTHIPQLRWIWIRQRPRALSR